MPVSPSSAFFPGSLNFPPAASVSSVQTIQSWTVGSASSNSKDSSFCVTYCRQYFSPMNRMSSTASEAWRPRRLCFAA